MRAVFQLRKELGTDHGTVKRVADQTGIGVESLRNWVKAFDAGKLNEPGTRAVTPEQMELSRLRVENLRLQRQCEILKKAAAYFATDAL